GGGAQGVRRQVTRRAEPPRGRDVLAVGRVDQGGVGPDRLAHPAGPERHRGHPPGRRGDDRGPRDPPPNPGRPPRAPPASLFLRRWRSRSMTESALACATIWWMTVLIPRGPHWQPCLR